MDKKKILIVDDEVDMLSLLETRLSAAGYSVIKAADGKEGLRLAKKEQPDMIILDIMMPGLGGDKVAEILKSEPDTRQIPIIFLTCLYTKEEESSQGHRIEGNFFIAKPFDQKELLSEIKNRLNNKKIAFGDDF